MAKKNKIKVEIEIDDDKVEKAVKKQAKKTIKKHGKAIAITIAVIALVLIITFVALYIFKPEVIQSIIDMFKPEPSKENPEDIPGIIPIEGEKLEVTVVDVGQGDGIVIEFPDGQVMLVDGGCRLGTFSIDEIYSRLEAVLSKTAKMKGGSKHIDYLMLTHADYDHLSTHEDIFENYEVENIYFPRIADPEISSKWNKVHQAALSETYVNENGETVHSNYTENIGNFVLSGDNWKLDCYSYLEEDYPVVKKSSNAHVKNEISPICILEYANRKIVLTGDATIETEEYLLSKPDYFKQFDADVLKVGHHGARESTSAEFLNYIDAEYAIISCATTDYGHPHQELLDRLKDYKDLTPDKDWLGFRETYITRDDGNVRVQVGQDGTMNLISTNFTDKNRSEQALSITPTALDVEQYAFIQKEEYFEEQYTLNCA